MIVGYDPERVAALAWKCRQALWALCDIHSSDPAADDAVAAVRRLHRTIETGVLAAADDIIGSAPLVRSFGARAPVGVAIRRRRRRDTARYESPTSSGTVADLFHDLALDRLLVEFALLSDDELLASLDDTWDSMKADVRDFDVDAPDWALRAHAFTTELERRVGSDSDLAERLPEWASGNPLAALVVSRTALPPAVTVSTLAAIATTFVSGPVRLALRDDATRHLLETVLAEPAMALDAIGRPSLVESLLAWDGDEASVLRLGVDDAVDLVDVAFSSADTYDLGTRDDPGDGERTARALAALVALMNSGHGERGLSAELSAAYTAGLVPLLPHFVHGFDGDEVFRLRRDDTSPIAVELGATNETMSDLLGGLARHSDSRSMLVGSIPALGPGIGLHYTAEQLAGFAATLGISMANEQTEERIHAGRQADRSKTALTLLDTGLDLGGVVPRSADATVGIGLDVARWSVDRLVTEEHLGLGGAPRAIEMMLVVALAGRTSAELEREDQGSVDDVLDQLARIDAHLDSAHGAAPTGITGEIDLLRDLVDRAIDSSDLDVDTRRRVERLWAALDHDAFGAPPFRSGAGPDLQE